MLKLSAVLALMLALGGCSLSSEYRALKAVARAGVDTAIQDRKDWNDTAAKVKVALPCDSAIGSLATGRGQLSDRKRLLILELCDVIPEGSADVRQSFTMDDVAAIMRAFPTPPAQP